MPSISICGTTTLSQPKAISEFGRSAVPFLSQGANWPVFAEPWEAQAFALAVTLSEQGHFTWKEWTAALGDELNGAASRGEPGDGSHYYRHWLAALEGLLMAKGLTDPEALLARKVAWAAAYRCTPHGRPVELAGDSAASANR